MAAKLRQLTAAAFLIALVLICCGCQSPLDRLKQECESDEKLALRRELTLRVYHRSGEDLVQLGVRGQEALKRVLPLLDGVNIVILGIGDAELSHADLQQISRLPLKELTLGRCTADVEDLKFLGQIETLEEFNSSPCLFTDDDLAFLQSLKHLKRLQLAGEKIEGFGLRYLDGLNELEEISLTGCPITDEGLAKLPHLPKLEEIGVSQTNVTPDGLRHLVPMTSLKQVHAPDGLLSKHFQELYQLHLEARDEARQKGLRVPSDEVVPYGSIKNMDPRDLKSRDEQILRLQKEGRLTIPGQ